MTIEFSVGEANLKRLVAEFSVESIQANEAQTRYSFIDRFLRDCLGWSDAGAIKVETIERGDRTDYECGQPRQLIIEAKRADVLFRFAPRGVRSKSRQSLSTICAFDANLADAIAQAQGYCQKRGVQIGAVSNGLQLVFFLATRTDGVAPEDGDALVFTTPAELENGFNQIYECLSPDGIEEKRVVTLLSADNPKSLPPKLSTYCLDYFQYKYSSDFQESLKNAASLVIQDLSITPSLEEDFYKECYCESGPLSQYGLIGRGILAARYASLFSSDARPSSIEEVNPKKGNKERFTQLALAEALASRPIVLVGDVGVGKTSFIKHLLRVRASEEFSSSITIYLDLGSKGVLSKTPRDALFTVIEKTLREEHKINLQGQDLVSAIYEDELRDFDTGILSSLKDINPSEWQSQRLSFVAKLMSAREEHLRRVISYKGRIDRKQIIFVIDNADQRNLEVQQEAFLISQELATHWGAMVFLTLRPQTFHASKRSGAISAYPPKVFVVPPPKLEDVIEKRLAFALRIAEGSEQVQGIPGLTLHVDSLAVLIRVLLNSLRSNKELLEFIVNVSAGNVRVAVELIGRFFGSPNVESDRIVQIVKDGANYVVPVHEFAKAALLTDYAHFQEEASTATNVFFLNTSDVREHFLSFYILGYLAWESSDKQHREGFVGREQLVAEIQSCGYTQDQIEMHVTRLTRKKLLESTERQLLESVEELRDFGLPESFRITSLGAYHLKRWTSDFSFVEAMAFDTPILDAKTHELLRPSVNDIRLAARFERASRFVEYLDAAWAGCDARAYFDWLGVRAAMKPSFSRVERALSR